MCHTAAPVAAPLLGSLTSYDIVLKLCHMAKAKLQPTLWRTCRVLANPTRLKIIALLLRRPSLAVSQVAATLRLARPIASTYLRALESRGVLDVNRRGRWTRYQITQKPMKAAAGPLVTALAKRIKKDGNCLDGLYRLATAFASPGRIQVFRELGDKPLGLAELRKAT